MLQHGRKKKEKSRDSHRRKKHTSLMKVLKDFERAALPFFFLKIQ